MFSVLVFSCFPGRGGTAPHLSKHTHNAWWDADTTYPIRFCPTTTPQHHLAGKFQRSFFGKPLPQVSISTNVPMSECMLLLPDYGRAVLQHDIPPSGTGASREEYGVYLQAKASAERAVTVIEFSGILKRAGQQGTVKAFVLVDSSDLVQTPAAPTLAGTDTVTDTLPAAHPTCPCSKASHAGSPCPGLGDCSLGCPLIGSHACGEVIHPEAESLSPVLATGKPIMTVGSRVTFELSNSESDWSGLESLGKSRLAYSAGTVHAVDAISCGFFRTTQYCSLWAPISATDHRDPHAVLSSPRTGGINADVYTNAAAWLEVGSAEFDGIAADGLGGASRAPMKLALTQPVHIAKGGTRTILVHCSTQIRCFMDSSPNTSSGPGFKSGPRVQSAFNSSAFGSSPGGAFGGSPAGPFGSSPAGPFGGSGDASTADRGHSDGLLTLLPLRACGSSEPFGRAHSVTTLPLGSFSYTTTTGWTKQVHHEQPASLRLCIWTLLLSVKRATLSSRSSGTIGVSTRLLLRVCTFLQSADFATSIALGSTGALVFWDRTEVGASTLASAALGRDDVDMIVWLLDHGMPADIQLKCRPTLPTLLHASCMTGNTDIVRALAQHGADVDAPGWDGNTPVFDYVVKGDQDMVRFLVRHGARLNTGIDDDDDDAIVGTTHAGQRGNDPLHHAVKAGNVSMVGCLLKLGADPNAYDRDQRTPGHIISLTDGRHNAFQQQVDPTVAESDRVTIVELLAKHGAHMNLVDNQGSTPLHTSARYGLVTVTKKWIVLGADANLTPPQGQSPLATYAHQSGDVGDEIVAFMAQSGKVDLNQLDDHGQTLLTLYAGRPNAKMIATLLEHGADVDRPNAQGRTPVACACDGYSKGNIDAVRILVDHGAQVDICARNTGDSAVHFAARSGSLEIVQYVASRGRGILDAANRQGAKPAENTGGNAEVADFFESWARGATPWTVLGHTKQPENMQCGILSVLLAARRRGAEEHWPILPREMWSAVFKCMAGNDFFFVRVSGRMGAFLLWNGLTSTAVTLALSAVLDSATTDMGIVEYLLDRGADLGRPDEDGATLLDTACAVGDSVLVRCLIERGVDPNIQSSEGTTPIQHFSVANDADMVCYLIEHGADPSGKGRPAPNAPEEEAAAKDKKEEAAPDDRPFTAEDIGMACWLQLGAQDAPAWARAVQLRVMAVSAIQGIHIQRHGGGNEHWIEGFKLQRADPNPAAKTRLGPGYRKGKPVGRALGRAAGGLSGALVVGDEVRVRADVGNARFGWGSVKHDMVGRITSIDDQSSEGRCSVDFSAGGGDRNWSAILSELESTRVKVDELPLNAFAAHYNDHMVTLLLERGVDPNSESSPGEPMVFLYAKRGNAAMVECFIEHGASVDSVSKLLKTNDKVVISHHIMDVAIAFKIEGSDPNRGGFGAKPASRPASHLTAKQVAGKSGIVQSIQTRTAVALPGTAAVGLKDVTIILEETSDEVTLESSVVSCNRTLLAHYIAVGNIGMVEYLVQKGAKADIPSAVGGTPCCSAARAKDNVVLTLLKTDPDVNAGDEDGNSALHALLMPPVPVDSSGKLKLGPKCTAGHTMELEKLDATQLSNWMCSGCSVSGRNMTEPADERYIWTCRECAPSTPQVDTLPELRKTAQALGAIASLGTKPKTARESLDGAMKERSAYTLCEMSCFPSPFWHADAGLATANGVKLVYAARDGEGLPDSAADEEDAQPPAATKLELLGTPDRVVAKLMHTCVGRTSFAVEVAIRRLDGVKALSIGLEVTSQSKMATASNVDWKETTGNNAIAFYNGVSGVIAKGGTVFQAKARRFVDGDRVKLEINKEERSLTFYVNDVEVGSIPRIETGRTGRVAVEIIGGDCELEILGVSKLADMAAEPTGGQIDWVPAEDTKDAMTEMATALIACGANLNLVNARTETPAALAVAHGVRCKGDFRILDLIVAAMGNVDIADIKGNSPLLCLLRTGRDLPASTMLPVVKALLDAGASASAANDEGDTPPALAAMIGKVTQDYSILAAVLDAGGDVNAASSKGQTPLHIMLCPGGGDTATRTEVGPVSRRWKAFGPAPSIGLNARIVKEGSRLEGDTNNYPVVGELGVSPGEKVTWKLSATNWVGLAASSMPMKETHGPRCWMICLASTAGNTLFDTTSGTVNTQLKAALCEDGGHSHFGGFGGHVAKPKTFELELDYPAAGPAKATIIHNAKRHSLCNTINGRGEKLSLVTTHYTSSDCCEVLAVRSGAKLAPPTVKPDINAPGNALFKVINASVCALNGFYGLDIGLGRRNGMPQYVNMGPVPVPTPLTVNADPDEAEFAQTTAFSPPPSPFKTVSPTKLHGLIFYDATGCWMVSGAPYNSSAPYKALSSSVTPPAFGWMPNEGVVDAVPPELVWFNRPKEQTTAATPLERSTTRMVVDLLKRDVNFAAGDAQGNTVSMLAACMEATAQEYPITEMLLASGGCDVTLANNEGDTMLHMVLSLAQPPFKAATVALVELLIATGAGLNAANKLGQTPTLLAALVGARMRDFGILRRCVDNGGDVNVAAGSDGNNVLHILLLTSASPLPDDTVGVLQFLFENNVNSSAVNKRGCTAAIIATTMWATTHDYSVLAALIALEADVSTPDKDGNTVLHHLTSAVASATGDAVRFIVTLVDALVAAGVSFDVADRSGDTPLHRFLRSGCGTLERGACEALTQRLAANTNLSATNNAGCTPVIVAVTTVINRTSEELIGLEKLNVLMQCNPDLNTPDIGGKTALHYVAGAISDQVCDRMRGAPPSVPPQATGGAFGEPTSNLGAGPVSFGIKPPQQAAVGAFGQPRLAGAFGQHQTAGGAFEARAAGAFAFAEPQTTAGAFGPGAFGQPLAAGAFGQPQATGAFGEPTGNLGAGLGGAFGIEPPQQARLGAFGIESSQQAREGAFGQPQVGAFAFAKPQTTAGAFGPGACTAGAFGPGAFGQPLAAGAFGQPQATGAFGEPTGNLGAGLGGAFGIEPPQQARLGAFGIESSQQAREGAFGQPQVGAFGQGGGLGGGGAKLTLPTEQLGGSPFGVDPTRLHLPRAGAGVFGAPMSASVQAPAFSGGGGASRVAGASSENLAGGGILGKPSSHRRGKVPRKGKVEPQTGPGGFAQPKPFGTKRVNIADTPSSPAMEPPMEPDVTETTSKMAKLLISSGASLAAVDKNNNTPLHTLLMARIRPSAVHAVSNVVEYMCDRGSANVNAVNVFGDSALGLSAQADKGDAKYALLRLLVGRGGKVNLASTTHPLIVQFADRNDLDMVRYVCDHGADLDVRGGASKKTRSGNVLDVSGLQPPWNITLPSPVQATLLQQAKRAGSGTFVGPATEDVLSRECHTAVPAGVFDLRSHSNELERKSGRWYASITASSNPRFNRNSFEELRFGDYLLQQALSAQQPDEGTDGPIGATATSASEADVEMPVFTSPFSDILVQNDGRAVHVPRSSCHGGFQVTSSQRLTGGQYTWSMQVHGGNARVGVATADDSHPSRPTPSLFAGSTTDSSIFTDRHMTPNDGIVDFTIDLESRVFRWSDRSSGLNFHGTSRCDGGALTPVVTVNHGATIICVAAGTGSMVGSDASDIIVAGGSGSVGSKLNGTFKRLEPLRNGGPCYTHERGDGCLFYDGTHWKICQVRLVRFCPPWEYQACMGVPTMHGGGGGGICHRLHRSWPPMFAAWPGYCC